MLREPIDTFFEQVMVMVNDYAIRNNLLTLLATIHALFLEVADITKLPLSRG